MLYTSQAFARTSVMDPDPEPDPDLHGSVLILVGWIWIQKGKNALLNRKGEKMF
jgi:hypothetical protein